MTSNQRAAATVRGLVCLLGAIFVSSHHIGYRLAQAAALSHSKANLMNSTEPEAMWRLSNEQQTAWTEHNEADETNEIASYDSNVNSKHNRIAFDRYHSNHYVTPANEDRGLHSRSNSFSENGGGFSKKSKTSSSSPTTANRQELSVGGQQQQEDSLKILHALQKQFVEQVIRQRVIDQDHLMMEKWLVDNINDLHRELKQTEMDFEHYVRVTKNILAANELENRNDQLKRQLALQTALPLSIAFRHTEPAHHHYHHQQQQQQQQHIHSNHYHDHGHLAKMFANNRHHK